jgi:hypothetical protein
MLNNRTSMQPTSIPNAVKRWRVACVFVFALLPALGSAQITDTLTVAVFKTGFHSVYEGDVLHATVSEVGALDATSKVTIEFRDALDRRRAFTSATLRRATGPVRLRLAVPVGAGRAEFRVIVGITPIGGESQPIVGLEDIDVNSLRVVPKVFCAPEPSRGGGPEGHCDGWRITFLTLGEAGTAPD